MDDPFVLWLRVWSPVRVEAVRVDRAPACTVIASSEEIRWFVSCRGAIDPPTKTLLRGSGLEAGSMALTERSRGACPRGSTA